MKQFESNLRAKAHISKIKNAKTTLINSISTKIKINNKNQAQLPLGFGNISTTSNDLNNLYKNINHNQDQITLILKLYDCGQFSSIPVYKLLKHSGLQQYTRQMILRGFGVSIGKLGYLEDKERQKMFQDLKILPGHSLKFLKLIQEIRRMEQKPNRVRMQMQEHQQRYIRNIGIQGHMNIQSNYDSGKGAKINIYNKNKNKGNLMKEIDEKDNYESQLQKIFKRYTPYYEKKNNNNTNDKKQGQFKDHKNYLPLISKQQIQSKKINTNLNQNQNVNIKKKIQINTIPSIPKHNINVNLNSISNTKILNQTYSKKPYLKSVSPISSNQKKKKIEKSLEKGLGLQLNLNIDKIKGVFRSVDGGIMTSTIVNIDLQQSCTCIAAYLQKRIKAGTRKQKGSKQNKNEEKLEKIQRSDDNQDQIEDILRESYLHPLYKQSSTNDVLLEDANIQQQINQSIEQDNINELKPLQSQQQNIYNNDINELLQQSSFLGNNFSVCFNTKTPLQIFDQPNPTELDYYIPTVDSLSNFIKNIVVSAKMEREVPILSILYVQKFIKNTKLQITSLNYKRILISCLLLASKVWDDESFQTPSFSHTFPDYSTVLLNELQKQILVNIDYELKLEKKQYALIYFKLRQFRSKQTKSYKNKAINILKVRQLQNGIKKDSKSLWGEIRRKSF